MFFRKKRNKSGSTANPLLVLFHQQANCQLAAHFNLYLPLLKGKNVALVVNQTSMLGNTHLVDTLLSQGVSIKKIFAPEHGFRGVADAGEHVEDGIDTKTKLPIISLYGKHRKPTAKDLNNIDVVIFDIQDVGVRFYTYISTMHYVMEACVRFSLPVVCRNAPHTYCTWAYRRRISTND